MLFPRFLQFASRLIVACLIPLVFPCCKRRWWLGTQCRNFEGGWFLLISGDILLCRLIYTYAMSRLVREGCVQRKKRTIPGQRWRKLWVDSRDKKTSHSRKGVPYSFLGRCRSRRERDCLTIRCTLRIVRVHLNAGRRSGLTVIINDMAIHLIDDQETG